MRPITLFLGLLLSFLLPEVPVSAATFQTSKITPPKLNREFRGAWVASVVNIDWPSTNSNVVENLKSRGQPQYLEEILHPTSEAGEGGSFCGGGDGEGGSESDPLYDEAVNIVIESRRASVSGIQRRLKIGYNRAARMVEEMERAGLVGPLQSNGNREVLVPAPVKD